MKVEIQRVSSGEVVREAIDLSLNLGIRIVLDDGQEFTVSIEPEYLEIRGTGNAAYRLSIEPRASNEVRIRALS